ncbi:MAG TPA: hypothetical protein VEG35_00520, partial [Burkholderiales bacterium]|nr:hypothetical protein [Burkholderiales bacterium]
AVERDSFPAPDFLRSLLTSGAADLISLGRAEESAQETGFPVLRSILELDILPPARLWALLEEFVKAEAVSLFDNEEGGFEFTARPSLSGPAYIRGLSVPRLLIEGGRQMANHGLIGRHLPAETETVLGLRPPLLDRLELEPHEHYLLGLLDTPRTLAELLESSDLGTRETRRTLFIFLCLGLAGTRAPKPKTARLPAEMSLAEVEKTFAVFNAKCSYIFKYISKEIGPVALSIIRNSLEDVRTRLDPVFQGLELKPDGRIEVKTFLKTNMNLVGDESRRSLLRSMDEILVAEVLAVKRTLGPGHESALVRSLEKVGELP